MATPREFFDTLKNVGVNVLEFNPVNPLHLRKGWAIDERDHRKLLVVDGRIAFIGGVNISSVYTSGSAGKKKQRAAAGRVPWRDTQLRMEGPVVRDFQQLFMDTWENQKGAPQTDMEYFPQLESQGPEVVRAIGSSPAEPYSLMYSTLLAAIDNADSQILLTNAYFVPDAVLLAALQNAARRGVDVKLLLPGKTDSVLVFHASRSFYEALLRAGVKIYERQNRILHAKTAVIDGVWSTVGSTNLDWRSHLHNLEVNAIILGPEFGTQMQVMFDNDLAASRQVLLADWRHRPLVPRLMEISARLWARLL
jgi:cardiolipin synthase